MASPFGFVDPRSISRAVAAALGGGEEAGARAEQSALRSQFLRERILRARQERAGEDADRAAFGPEPTMERTSAETGTGLATVREIVDRNLAGQTANDPTHPTYVPPGQFGPSVPADQGVVDRVLAAHRRNTDPVSRTNPQRVATGLETARQGGEAADMVARALRGELDEPVRGNAVAQARGVGSMRNPNTIVDHTPINREGGAVGQPTEVGRSVIGLNEARAGTEQARQRERNTAAAANTARANRTSALPTTPSGRPAPTGRAGADPNQLTAEGRRKLRASAESAAKQRGLTGRAADEFVQRYIENPDRISREPLSGASPPESVRREFAGDPANKGRRLGSYEAGRGYVVYDGKRAIGYVNEVD